MQCHLMLSLAKQRVKRYPVSTTFSIFKVIKIQKGQDTGIWTGFPNVKGHQWKCTCTRQQKSHLCIPFLGISVPISTFMCLWAINIFPGPHIFLQQNKQMIVGTYKSLTDTWMWKLGLWPRNFFSGNMYFKFSILVLCSFTLINVCLLDEN